MEEMKGICTAINLLGERIAQLESDLRFERMMKEDATKRVDTLMSENAKLRNMLDKVQDYIDLLEDDHA